MTSLQFDIVLMQRIEKIGDAINYMILLEAIFREEMQK